VPRDKINRFAETLRKPLSCVDASDDSRSFAFEEVSEIALSEARKEKARDFREASPGRSGCPGFSEVLSRPSGKKAQLTRLRIVPLN